MKKIMFFVLMLSAVNAFAASFNRAVMLRHALMQSSSKEVSNVSVNFAENPVATIGYPLLAQVFAYFEKDQSFRPIFQNISRTLSLREAHFDIGVDVYNCYLISGEVYKDRVSRYVLYALVDCTKNGYKADLAVNMQGGMMRLANPVVEDLFPPVKLSEEEADEILENLR